jgi:RimJ/RimL family protein N-acetyltransferase
VGWTLAREAWGHGYATEAAKVSVAWAWRSLEVERLISVIDPANTSSIAVAERLGMHRPGADEHRGRPVMIMALDRPGTGTAAGVSKLP